MSKKTNELEKVILRLTIENSQLKEQLETKNKKSQIYFWEYLFDWLENQKNRIRLNSYLSYLSQMNKHIIPYFKQSNILLCDVTPEVLEAYYFQKINCDKLSATTVHKHHANIHSALKNAVRSRLIQYNPSDYVIKPKATKYVGNYLNAEQLNNVFKLFENNRMYTPILLAGTLGLRRSETLGLKWNAIDFNQKTIHIRHTVVKVLKDNKYTIQCNDLTKTNTSNRLLPVPDKLLNYLQLVRNKQINNYMRDPINYNKEYLKYVCVDQKGDLIKPDDLSNRFRTKTKSQGYDVRFHDLRHSCASILADEGMDMKDISVWLGHSSINVTSDIYVHLFYQKKLQISNKINQYVSYNLDAYTTKKGVI